MYYVVGKIDENSLNKLATMTQEYGELRPTPWSTQDHPNKCGEIAFSILNQDGCIIANNPYWIDRIPANKVLVFNGSNFKHLDENSQFNYWQGDLSTGEFWSYVGETWVTPYGV